MNLHQKNSNLDQNSELDPQVKLLISKMEKLNAPPLNQLSPEQARENMNAATALAGPPEPVALINNIRIPGPSGEIPIRIYKPENDGPFPALIYYHGGGWVTCSLDTHDNICRSFSNRARCVVASVDYRLAPEHKFPAAIDDAYYAAKWIFDNAKSIDCDSTRIAVGGDSAGGNLAAVVSILSRDRGIPDLIFQLLLYPVTDISNTNTVSYENFAEGCWLTKADMEWFRDHYLEKEDDCKNIHASPLLAKDLSGLPNAFIITAGFDVLRDEGEAYAQRLQQAGVSAYLSRYNSMIHGFLSMDGVIDKAKDAINEAATALDTAFYK